MKEEKEFIHITSEVKEKKEIKEPTKVEIPKDQQSPATKEKK
ncbi:MAG TPA: hypothetical protein VFF57_12135 [Hanamia sp.]|nr:hypothetical protein [Hanamia sp.]